MSTAKPILTLGELPAPPPHHRYLAEVMEAADGRCQCTGQCRNKKDHNTAPGGGIGRCFHTVSGRPVTAADGELVGYVGIGDNDRQVVVAPADPGTSAAVAARLPVEQLRAWCLGCLHKAEWYAARDRRQQLAAELADTQGALFDESEVRP